MLLFPFAKINLGLNVVRRRPDGYHDIETALVPIPLTDAIEVVPAPGIGEGQLRYTRSGIVVPGPSDADLCVRAHGLLAARRKLPGLAMHLHKRIPMGAGLGGGSSDGTHALLAIDRLLGLSTSVNELHAMALQLGSDCPFFLERKARLVRGRGEVLDPLAVDLRGLWLVLVNPGVHVATAEAYALVEPTERTMDLAHVLQALPVEQWSERAPNVMEAAVMERYPVIGEALAGLKHQGAAHAAMSGSGATVFGLFRERPAPASWPAEFTTWTFKL